MNPNVSDQIIERLLAWGVTRIFGFPGDGINGLMGAIARTEGRLDFVQVRHEEMAAFMACAHAKFTGEPGVCLATSGPGAIHLLNGLYDASLDHQPVVAIVGQQARAALGGSYQQEVDLTTLFKDVAHEYVQVISVPEQVRHVVDRSVRIARAERAVTCMIVPNDVQELEAVFDPPHLHGTIHSSLAYAAPRVIPHEDDLQQAADLLNAGERVAMLVGAGAAGARTQLEQVADRLGAGAAKALLGKTTLPDTLPWVTGSIGLLGTRPSWELMMECDTLLMVGTSFPYSEFLPPEGQARAVQVDLDPRMLGLRYPTEVNLAGDSAATLDRLLPLLDVRDRSAWRDRVEASVTDWWRVMDGRAAAPANPINPQRVFAELSDRLPDRCILTSDSGTSANWYARHLVVRDGMSGSLSGNLATKGVGVPYAIAAKFAQPDRPVIAMVGDGAMQMNGNAELLTAAKYQDRWSNPTLVVLVLHNGDLNQVTWEQRAMLGDPKFEASQEIPDFPFARYAELIGLHGIRVDDPDDIGAAWDEALACGRPCVLEAITDPDVPPLPPHITFEQARNFMSSVLHGDEDRVGMVARSTRQMWEAARR
jgi:pyruvate dehydrogenase (quinone)